MNWRNSLCFILTGMCISTGIFSAAIHRWKSAGLMFLLAAFNFWQAGWDINKQR